MKKGDQKLPRALIVADATGHVIERMGKSWQAHSRGISFEVVTTDTVSVLDCCRRGCAAGQVWWFDTRRALRAMRVAQCPQVVVVHHHMPGEEGEVKQLAENCDAMLAVSRCWQDRLQKLTGHQVWLAPLSTNTGWFKPRADRSALRAQIGIMPETLVIGFVAKAGANVGDRKGTGILREVVTRLRLAQPWALLLTGTGWDDFAQELRLLGIHVIQQSFPNCLETVKAYQLMDVLLITAREEGGPATLLEAMACGVPVISSPVGHVTEVITDGKTGIICGIGHVASYVQALERLAKQEAMRTLLSVAGRELVVSQWDDAKVIPQINMQGIYDEAHRRFGGRTPAELLTRSWRWRWLELRKHLGVIWRVKPLFVRKSS